MIGHQNFQNGGVGFAPYVYPPISQPTVQPQYATQDKRPTIQYSGVVQVKSEEEAKGYPVGPGVGVTFKHESQPFIYTKTMGFNQLEQPVFKKYRLVEETEEETPQVSEIEELRSQIAELRELIKSSINKSSSKKIIKEESNE